ncbi:SDR family NAD(P)-dependent oxidoreductase [Streptomyces humi]|uniref:SDR family NAD(P)-dependent oxidoreductase n=1 Tax=Streptomyces humi TaxID=1428620 RepID=UPI0006287875|nr:SDR family oxidoreductase [Streptomyces humi]
MTGRRALVTGACKGLGRYLAASLAAEGWDVTGVGRCPEERVPAVPGVTYLQADLSRPQAATALSGRLDPALDLVVHCAVAYPPARPSGPVPRDLEEVFRVNAFAPYLLALDLLARKPADRFCSHVVVNSEAIYGADDHSAVYAASKAALRVLTAGLAAGCRSAGAAVATLLLGPLADRAKLAEAETVAARKGLPASDVVRLFLRRSNPNLVIDEFIDYASCLRSVRYLAELGPTANGMLCKLDGGSSGSLV